MAVKKHEFGIIMWQEDIIKTLMDGSNAY